MSAALLFATAAGTLIGAVATATIVEVRWRRRADQHHYDRVRLEATRVREVCDTADHEHRLRIRTQRELDRRGAIIDALYTRLGNQRPRPRPARHYRSAVPRYGAHRLEATP